MLATPDDFGDDAMGAGDDREIRSLNKLSRLLTPQVARSKVWITYALILSFLSFHANKILSIWLYEPALEIDSLFLWNLTVFIFCRHRMKL